MPATVLISEPAHANAFARFYALTPGERALDRLTALFRDAAPGRWWRSDSADDIEAAEERVRNLTRQLAWLERRYGPSR